MSKLTLLEITQNILSALDSDPVDSIDETVESDQVATIVKESYFELMSQRDWAHLRQLFNLEGLADTDNPTKMRMPATANKVLWLKYNKKDVQYLDPKEFKDIIDARVETTDVIDANGYVINNDPVYWTTYDDDYVLFDGRDNTLDATLQASKAVCFGIVAPTWTHTDGFTPDIPEKFFPTLLAEAKAQAFVNLKQQSNVREERKAQRGRVIMQNEHWRNEAGEVKYNSKVNYGRK